MPLSVVKAGMAIDALSYGCTRPGAAAGEYRLPVPTAWATP
jgi:hypothetical protein